MTKFDSKSQNYQTFFNFLTIFIKTGASIITIPLYTRMLGTEQYGLYAIYLSWFKILSCIIGFNTGSGLGAGFYKYSDEYKKFRSSCLTCGIVIALIQFIIYILLIDSINIVIKYENLILIILFLDSLSFFVCEFAHNAWVYEKNANTNMLVTSHKILSGTILSIVLLVLWKGSNGKLYYGVIIGTALADIIFGLVASILIFKDYRINYSKVYWIYSLSYGVPVIFHTLGQQVLVQSDRVMMQIMGISSSEVGVYSFYYNFVTILTVMLTALNLSWLPFLFDDLTVKNYERINKRIIHYVQLFTVICCVFLMFSREVAVLFSGKEYAYGSGIVPILIMVVFMTYTYQFAVNYEFYLQKTKIIATNTIIAAIVNILLNLVLIPRYGMIGAGIATLIGYVVLTMMHFFIVFLWKHEKYPLSVKPVAIGSSIVLVFSILYYSLARFIFLRWMIGILLSIYISIVVYKRRSIF